MKKMLMFLAVVVVMAGCASLPPYFTNPNNTSVFADLGLNCVLAQPQQYGAGLMYEYLKTPTGYQMSQSHVLQVVVQCGNELYTVICDPNKGTKDNPCAGLQVWKPTLITTVAPKCVK